MFEPGYVPNPQKKSFDLTQALWNALQDSPITWRTQCVEGHTDDPEKLALRMARPQTRLEKLNCEMDTLAKAVWHDEQATGNPMQAPVVAGSQEEWSVWHGPNKISCPNTKALYDIIWAPKMKDYWTNAHRQG